MSKAPRHALVVLFLFAVSLYAQRTPRQLTLEEAISGRIPMKSLSSPQWIDGGKKFTYLELDSTTKQNALYSYDTRGGKRQLLLSGAAVAPLRFGAYGWSTDGKQLLLSEMPRARRRKAGGAFGVYSVASKTFRLLTDVTRNTGEESVKISPNGAAVGFVRENDLYVVDVQTGNEKRLTSDGSDMILNGKFDWVYEEEFSISEGWQWSPDSKKIAFWRLDQSGVPTFPLVRYSADTSKATIEIEHYPKAGDPNALVKIGVVTVATGAVVWLDVNAGPDSYLPRIQWTNDPSILSVQWLNRTQDTLRLMLADVNRGTLKTVMTESSGGWIDIQNTLTFLKKSPRFFWTSNRDGYNHLYLYNLDGSLVRQVTKGPWEVSSVDGIDENNENVFFTATEVSPLERHLYRISFNGSGMSRLTSEPGTHSSNVAPDCGHYLDTYSSTKTPPRVLLSPMDGKAATVIVDNNADRLAEYVLGDHQFFTFKTEDGDSLRGWMLKPPDFDPAKKYPLLITVYGGPGSQTVKNAWGDWSNLWHQYLLEKGYVIASVDNRGTGARGKTFLQKTYRRLGVQETLDQVSAAQYLGRMPYVDSTRIGMWGWSFGGFMTCMALTLGADHFKTGVAVAPVTNWKYYDSIYTERYMDTPGRNPGGYHETSPISHAAKMKGNLLVIHGTTDDNVHWQNTIVFVNELIRQNKQVQTMFYPGRSHGISGDNATRHLYTLMTQYILEKL
jgi:dipeptidyl-peptidase-4